MKNSYLPCLIASQLAFLSCYGQKGNDRPNFILFIADDVSWDDIGCYGNREVKTPNIDRLASEGIRFSSFFLTASSSSPSRNSLITGRYPHNTGGAELHSEPPDFMVSFPEILRESGYYTAQAGKFHMGAYARRGFDRITDGPVKLVGDGGEDHWITTLRERDRSKPFFMWFAAHDAHRSWGPNIFSGTHKAAQLNPPHYLAQGMTTKNDLAAYYDEIARFDHYIGQVYEELEREHISDNTIILIMADNGRPFPHSKTRVNDRGLKTPFIIHWPAGRGRKPEVCDALVSSIDIAPTILAIAGDTIPDVVQGISFFRLISDPSEKFRKYVFAEHNWHDYEAHERMVRTKDHLYILNSRPQFPQMGPADAVGSLSMKELDSLRIAGKLTLTQSDVFTAPRPPEELYYCKSDPEQFRNRAVERSAGRKMRELKGVLREWMELTGDNIPENITKDWYLREPGYIKSEFINKRGEGVDKKYNATHINDKGKF